MSSCRSIQKEGDSCSSIRLQDPLLPQDTCRHQSSGSILWPCKLLLVLPQAADNAKKRSKATASCTISPAAAAAAAAPPSAPARQTAAQQSCRGAQPHPRGQTAVSPASGWTQQPAAPPEATSLSVCPQQHAACGPARCLRCCLNCWCCCQARCHHCCPAG